MAAEAALPGRQDWQGDVVAAALVSMKPHNHWSERRQARTSRVSTHGLLSSGL